MDTLDYIAQVWGTHQHEIVLMVFLVIIIFLLTRS